VAVAENQPSRQGKRKVCATFLFLGIVCSHFFPHIYLRGCHLEAASVKIKQPGGEKLSEIKYTENEGGWVAESNCQVC